MYFFTSSQNLLILTNKLKLNIEIDFPQKKLSRFWTGRAENVKYKFRFAKKWTIICIN